MESKDIKNMTNIELKLYQNTLEDEYEVIKKQISDLFEELDKMDIEYNKIENEINKRKSFTR